jgi:hypothetical protein
LLAGAIFAKYFVDAREKNQEVKFIKYSTIIGLISLLLGHLFYSGLSPQVLTSIVPNPVFYIERMGYLLVLFFLCWIIDKKINIKNSFIMDASRESLLVYWLHLVIIYGMFWGGKSLAVIIGTKLNALEALITTLILIFIMIIIAKIWGWLKRNYLEYVSISVKIVVVILIIIFLIY